MIKVNLLKGDRQNRGGATQIGNKTQFGLPNFGANSSDGANFLKKILIMLFPIIGAYGYSWYIQNDLNGQKNELNQKIANTEQQTVGLKPQLEEIEKLGQEKNKVQTQIGMIRDISKLRYNSVKLMDSLQTLIPEKAWLVRLSINDRNISIEGRAIDDMIISTFMQNLEESAYFSNVSLNDSKEVNEPQGLVKQFSIKFQLEKI